MGTAAQSSHWQWAGQAITKSESGFLQVRQFLGALDLLDSKDLLRLCDFLCLLYDLEWELGGVYEAGLRQ